MRFSFKHSLCLLNSAAVFCFSFFNHNLFLLSNITPNSSTLSNCHVFTLVLVTRSSTSGSINKRLPLTNTIFPHFHPLIVKNVCDMQIFNISGEVEERLSVFCLVTVVFLLFFTFLFCIFAWFLPTTVVVVTAVSVTEISRVPHCYCHNITSLTLLQFCLSNKLNWIVRRSTLDR